MNPEGLNPYKDNKIKAHDAIRSCDLSFSVTFFAAVATALATEAFFLPLPFVAFCVGRGGLPPLPAALAALAGGALAGEEVLVSTIVNTKYKEVVRNQSECQNQSECTTIVRSSCFAHT